MSSSPGSLTVEYWATEFNGPLRNVFYAPSAREAQKNAVRYDCNLNTECWIVVWG